ncbi:hypothetical protein MKW98_028189 [Papaver atlanticum]|uniref:3'-5' exonuclease domain-containing protein n=1 Tax=Papaver atlanticum TaxID=357466 RepID=A0AAD4SXF7_9MAGN|nr:hypothetical protein MKW98_028189 [Papaver atlanticum]
MAGQSVQKVENDSSTNGGSAGGDKKNTGIEVGDKSKDTHHTYKVFYYKDTIFTTVTHRASVVDQWLADLYKQYTKQSCCVADKRCLIFQFAYCDQVPKSLKDFLGNDKFIFVGSGVHADAYKLMVDHGLMVARTEELGSLAAYKLAGTFKDYRDSRLHKTGLKNLVKDVLQQDLPKRRYLLSNWERGVLRDEQIEYACLDAFVSYKLGVDLMRRAKNNNRQPEMVLKDSEFPELKKAVEEKTKRQVL